VNVQSGVEVNAMMKRSSPAALFLLIGLVACRDASPITPTSPTAGPGATAAPPAPVPPPSARGEIRVAAVTHASGSTLTVHDCGQSWSGIAGNHVCTEEWRGAFDIVIDRDVPNADLTVSFGSGSRRCGEVFVGNRSFAANRRRLVSTEDALFLTYEPEGDDNLSVIQRCELPFTTQNLVVNLWDRDGGSGSAAVPLLRSEFAYAYEFSR
jgi:hypothetical protein